MQGSFQAHASEQKSWLASDVAICFTNPVVRTHFLLSQPFGYQSFSVVQLSHFRASFHRKKSIEMSQRLSSSRLSGSSNLQNIIITSCTGTFSFSLSLLSHVGLSIRISIDHLASCSRTPDSHSAFVVGRGNDVGCVWFGQALSRSISCFFNRLFFYLAFVVLLCTVYCLRMRVTDE